MNDHWFQTSVKVGWGNLDHGVIRLENECGQFSKWVGLEKWNCLSHALRQVDSTADIMTLLLESGHGRILERMRKHSGVSTKSL